MILVQKPPNKPVMKLASIRLVPIFLFTLALVVPPIQAEEFQSLFDGKSLDGWKGADGLWSVQDGAIVGQTNEGAPIPANTFLVWQGGEVSDFEFSCQVKFEGNNSGVQYRSQPVDEAGLALMGYQADLHPKAEYFGMLYGEKYGKRGIIAQRHQRIEIGADEKKKVIAKAAPSTTLTGTDWNTLRIVAVGNRLVHLINGVVTVDVTDQHPAALASGKLGLQLHAGSAMKVEFKDLQYRPLAGDLAQTVLKEAIAAFPEAKTAAAPTSGAWISADPKPAWIWRADKTDNQPIYLRHSFAVAGDIRLARLYTTCDNGATVWINGKEVGTAPDWQHPIIMGTAAPFLKQGENQIAVKAHNRGGIAAFVFKLEIDTADGKTQQVVSSKDWKLSLTGSEGWENSGFEDSGWGAKLKVMGTLGTAPWGIPGTGAAAATVNNTSGVPTASDGSIQLTTAKDFSAELLYTVPKSTQGSWVALCTEPGGGFYACDQGKLGLFHISFKDSEPTVRPVPLTEPGSKNLISGAQGLTWAMDSLWFHRNGGHLYRITDSNGDGELDTVEAQPSTTGGGEHGNHAVIPDETGQGLYLVAGNSSPIPPADAITRNRIQSWDEDHLLPRLWDARGHARGRLAPGGWISHFDPETKTHDLISMGYRNQYDTALNSAGDLFTYDADMEWDIGSHWYRPTRINFVVSGSDHGWRSGTGKWPTYYEDSLPPVVEIGPGSPTGLLAGTGAKFPTNYQRALYAFDWTFGTIWAIHLQQEGAGYVAKKEAFVSGVPLPVTDGVIGPDGHLYFLVGGRGTQSAMVRLSYTGSASTEPAAALDPTPERLLARELEAFHGVENGEAVAKAWPHLASPDVYLRHAARVAIESQPNETWADRLKAETDPQAIIAASVALARHGEAAHQPLVVSALQTLPFDALTERQKLGALRAYALTFIRLGKPTEDQRTSLITVLDPHLPNESANLNTELIRVLTYLESPTIVEKTVALIRNPRTPELPDWADIAARNPRYGATVKAFLEKAPPSREVYYTLMLASARQGWTTDARRASIELLNQAAKGEGGASFPGFLANIRELHLGAMSNEQRAAIADVSGENFNPIPDFEILPPKGPGQAYTIESASPHLNFRQANFERGRSHFFATSCGACHRMAGLGGDIGPDLTSIPNKFDARYVLEAIIHPSKDISDQYGMFQVTLRDGRTAMGLYVENGENVSIYPPDHTADPIEVTKAEVASVEQVAISQMPPGLINGLNPEELRDLMAYLMSGGNPESKVYR